MQTLWTNLKIQCFKKEYNDCTNFLVYKIPSPTFHSEERLVNLIKGREYFVGLSVLIVYGSWPSDPIYLSMLGDCDCGGAVVMEWPSLPEHAGWLWLWWGCGDGVLRPKVPDEGGPRPWNDRGRDLVHDVLDEGLCSRVKWFITFLRLSKMNKFRPIR